MGAYLEARIRKAKSYDIPALGEVAAEGFRTSPVYKFVRTGADKFPQDTRRSYREEFRKLIADPSILFIVLEVHQQSLVGEKHVTQCTQSGNKNQCGKRQSIRFANKTPGYSAPRVVGFAVWKLCSDSAKIKRTFIKTLKYLCVTARVELTSLFWKPRDINPLRAAKVDKIWQVAQRVFHQRERRYMELEQMVVHPEFQRQGFGTKLGKFGLKIAEGDNCSVGVLATPEGEKLYSNLDFQRLEGCGEVATDDGAERCALAVQIWRPVHYEREKESG
ncbi:hypothetical protein BDZ91DRAFT_732689 [Kalaharituber pfeilii]|nr:hypothetical protein BDZ91DRAFT_732689 [Kalaharituber pfeilii]